MEFRARTADEAWFDANVPCMIGCPVLTNAGRYVAAIAHGDDELSYLTARLPNPFPSICGRVCAAPCELRCRRGLIDEPIAIRALKRFACERHGVEGSSPQWEALLTPPPAERPERVAMIGAGPAGLACAHDLRRYGFPVTVFDAADRPGGMMVLGIPGYRLRRDVLNAEIEAILGLGAELRLGSKLGEDFTLSSLRADGYAAVFLGVGAMRSRDLDIPGNELDGVLRAVEFLLNFNLGSASTSASGSSSSGATPLLIQMGFGAGQGLNRSFRTLRGYRTSLLKARIHGRILTPAESQLSADQTELPIPELHGDSRDSVPKSPAQRLSRNPPGRLAFCRGISDNGTTAERWEGPWATTSSLAIENSSS